MTDATSPCPPEVSSEVLSGSAAVLFGLEHQFRVLHAQRTAPEAIKVVVELTAREGPCPACGVLTTAVKERPLSRLKDLPASGQRVELWWRKRRLACRETLCPRRSFPRPVRRCCPWPGH
jgi:transposase